MAYRNRLFTCLPINSMVIFHGYVNLPKGSYLPSIKHDGNIHHLARWFPYFPTGFNRLQPASRAPVTCAKRRPSRLHGTSAPGWNQEHPGWKANMTWIKTGSHHYAMKPYMKPKYYWLIDPHYSHYNHIKYHIISIIDVPLKTSSFIAF